MGNRIGQRDWLTGFVGFGDHACRVSALASLVIVLAFGPHPALAGDTVKGAQPGPRTGQLGPLDLVRSSLSRVLAIVQSQPARVPEGGLRRAEVRRVAEDLFDFDEMARRILAQHWKDRSPQEQAEFVGLFTDLLERAYLTTLGNYPLATMTFQDESVSGTFAQVRSRLITDRRVISIEYRLVETGGRWAVYDVEVDGVSLVSSYRSQFNSILRTSSFAELLERLRNREARVVPDRDPNGRGPGRSTR